MPSSSIIIIPAMINLAWECHPTTILDVGPGRGKYGLLLREYLGEDLTIDAIELWPPYVTDRLTAIYDIVITGDVLDLDRTRLAAYDLVVIADVIEHLEHADGLALLNRIPGWILVSTPRDFFQNPEADEIPPERHRSHWTPDDFAATGRLDYLDEGLLESVGGIVVRLAPVPR